VSIGVILRTGHTMKIGSVVLLVFLVMSGITLVAQQRGQRGGGGGGRDIVAQTRDALNLSTVQVGSLRTLLDVRAQSEQAAQDNIQMKLDALAGVQEKSPKDAGAIDRAAEDLRQAEQAQQAIVARFKTEFINLLTADQKKVLDSPDASNDTVNALARLGVINNGRGGRGRRGLLAANAPNGRGGRPGSRGRGALPSPANNPLTAEKVALGKQLFSDKRLSADGTLSCTSCHDPARAFSDDKTVARGIHEAEGSRNSPALIEVGFSRSFFWDGRAPTLESQVLQPILNPKELGLTEAELERRTGMKSSDVTDALASYVRTIRSTDSPYDRYQAGDTNALTYFEKAGQEVFRGKGNCAGCHSAPDFTDDQFHNTGVAWSGGRFTDEGRYSVTMNPQDHGSFKTPTLREVAHTAPYMHDGSLATLEDVVSFYAQGGHRNPYINGRVRPLALSSGEQKALVAFLKTLSGTVHDGL
jgi:cytochrome c peroxidase